MNWVQCLNLLFFVLQWVYVAIAFRHLPAAPDIWGGDTFFDFRVGMRALNDQRRLLACNCFLNWFKVVFFMSYIPVFALLLDTLALATPVLSGFILVF